MRRASLEWRCSPVRADGSRVKEVALGPAIEPLGDIAIPQAELRSDHHIVAHRRQRLANHLGP